MYITYSVLSLDFGFTLLCSRVPVFSSCSCVQGFQLASVKASSAAVSVYIIPSDKCLCSVAVKRSVAPSGMYPAILQGMLGGNSEMGYHSTKFNKIKIF